MNRIFKVFILFILFTKLIFAIEPIVTADVDKSSIYSGESVDITLSVIANKDSKIEFTHLKDINGVKTVKRKSSVSYDTVENGDKTEDIVEKKIIYTIKPTKNLDISPFIVKVDDKEYKSEALKITIIKDTKKEEPIKKVKKREFLFKILTDKKNVYELEPFIVTILLKEPVELASPSIKIEEPKFKNCKVTKLRILPQNQHETDYITIMEQYLVTPKKEGVINVAPITAEINMQLTPQVESMFGFFGSQSQIKRLKSNSLKVSVSAKPQKAQIVGNYTIKQSINKTKTSPNKQIVYSYKIEGVGDLTTFNDKNIKIDGVTIFPKDAKVNLEIKDGKVISSYEKKYVFISDRDFTIPSINIKAFSPTKKRLYSLSLKPIHITVTSKKAAISNILLNNTNNPTKKESVSQSLPTNSAKSATTEKNVKDNTLVETVLDTKYYQEKLKKLENPINRLYMLILGIVIGILITILTPKLIALIRTKDEKSELYGSYHEALNILYPHITESSDIEEMVKQLYEVTNGNREIKIDNKKLDKMVAKVIKSQNAL